VATPNAVALLEIAPAVVSSASAEVAMFDSDEAAACGLTHDVESCNTHKCSTACKVGEWGVWGPCTKACGGGKRGRQRLKSPSDATVVGADTCKGLESEFSSCKSQQCPASADLTCGARQDLMVMVSASELMTTAEFAEQKTFVKNLLSRFTLSRDQGGVAGLVLYGAAQPMVLPLTDSFPAIAARVEYAKIARGALKLDSGFTAAKYVFAGFSGRKDAPKTVLVLIKGKPDSVVLAIDQAAKLKESGVRVVVAVVGSCIVNKQTLEQLASEPSANNLFYFKSYQELNSKLDDQVVQLCPSLSGGSANSLPSQYMPSPASTA